MGRLPATELMLITAPLRRASMSGRARRVKSTAASTFTASSSRAVSAGMCVNQPYQPKPALFTSTSGAPQRAFTCAHSASRCAGLLRSAGKAAACPPAWMISAARASSRSARRAVNATRSPPRASRRAMAAPMPLEAPVTSASLPSQ